MRYSREVVEREREGGEEEVEEVREEKMSKTRGMMGKSSIMSRFSNQRIVFSQIKL